MKMTSLLGRWSCGLQSIKFLDKDPWIDFVFSVNGGVSVQDFVEYDFLRKETNKSKSTLIQIL